MKMKNEAITGRDVDFAQWYTDVCRKAELMDYGSVKGFIDYLPYGYAIWEEIQAYLNVRFKEFGTQNVYLPTVIPMSLFNKEKEHVEGFAPEILVCTVGGGKKLDEPLVIRPTSEVLFSDMYRRTLSSYRDLPKIYNQWCSVVRWEKTTRPFLRGAEFLWQEGHCLFETAEDAEKNTLQVLDVYYELGKDLLAIPFLKGRKTQHEKFAGAMDTYTVEALMHDGKALQCGTSHYFGTGFSEAYEISYQGRANKLERPYYTTWGVSTRLLGAIIMVHGDDNGLVLPPKVAPIQVVIVPVRQKENGVMEASQKLYEELKKKGIRVKLDADDTRTPGWKFSEYEMKGVPLRIEIGPRDLENKLATISYRVDGSKHTYPLDEITEKVPAILEDIHQRMYQRAQNSLQERTKEAHSLEELNELLKDGGFVKMAFCEKEECELKIKELTGGATARCIAEEKPAPGTKCPVCGEEATIVCYFAKAY